MELNLTAAIHKLQEKGCMKLEKYLKENKIKKTEFAKKIGISYVTLSRIIHKKNYASRQTMIKIFEHTNKQVTWEDLYDR